MFQQDLEGQLQFIDSHKHSSFLSEVSAINWKKREKLLLKASPTPGSPNPLDFFFPRKTFQGSSGCVVHPLINQLEWVAAGKLPLGSSLQGVTNQAPSPRHSLQPLSPSGKLDDFALADGEELPVYSPDFCFFLCFYSVLHSSAPQPLDMNFLL